MNDQIPAEQNGKRTDDGSSTTDTVRPGNSEGTHLSTEQQLTKVEGQMSGFERSTLRWARIAVVLSALAAAFVCAQWWEMHKGGNDTHKLATAAANQATWTQRLATNTDTESGHMKDLADRMKEQADQTKNLAAEAKAQVIAAKIAADAAKSAAETAKDALHVSERAYLTLASPVNDFKNQRMEVPIYNGGHIPSGSVTIVTHEATFSVEDANETIIPLSDLVETHWRTTFFQSVPVFQNGGIYQVEVRFPKLVQADLNSGKQAIAAAIVMTYNDGFPNTPEQTWLFCDISTFAAEQKLLTMRPCPSPNQVMQVLLKADHYPNSRYELK